MMQYSHPVIYDQGWKTRFFGGKFLGFWFLSVKIVGGIFGIQFTKNARHNITTQEELNILYTILPVTSF